MKNLISKVFDIKSPAPWHNYVVFMNILFGFVLITSSIITYIIYIISTTLATISNADSNSVLFLEKSGLITIFYTVVTMTAAMTALAGPAFAFYWSANQDKSAKIAISFDILKEWRQSGIKDAIFEIEKYFDGKDEKQACEELFFFTRRLENAGLRSAVRMLLSYLETIGTAAYSEHGDIKVFKKYFISPYTYYYNIFKCHINHVRAEAVEKKGATQEMADEIYKDFTTLAQNWIKEGVDNS